MILGQSQRWANVIRLYIEWRHLATSWRVICAALGALLLTACPSPAPRQPSPATAPAGATAASHTTTLTLEADPARVDRVQLVGELPGSPRALKQITPGRWTVKLGGLAQHRLYRYQYRVHRKDLGKWLLVSDPTARLLEPSIQRHSLLTLDRPPRPTLLRAMPAVRDLVIYELCPREFVAPSVPHAHPARDPGARAPGQVLRRITAKIRSGYFNRLGVNALELMPLTASAWTTHKRAQPERDPWGYSPISWYALNGDYGTPRDLVALVSAAHQRGLAVLLDYSLDHGSGGHRHGLLTDLHPTWRKARPTNPWGLLELDLTRPRTRRFLVGALQRFLVDYGIDGFRMDWTEMVDWQTWSHFVSAARRIKPGVLMISENPVKDLVARAGFDTSWDFFFQWEAPLLLRQVYQNHDGMGRVMVDTQHKLVENLTTWKAGPHAPPGPLVRYIESHDLPRMARPRVPWQHGGDQLQDVDGDGRTPDWLEHGGQRASRLGAVLLATVPGAVMIFAGQEHGAADELKWAHDPLNWRAANATTLAHYTRLLQLRRRTAALRSDDLRVLLNDTARHLLVYSRGHDPARADDDSAVVALNFGAAPLAGVKIKLPAVGPWRDLLTGEALPAGRAQAVDLPAQGWAVWGR